MQMRVDRYSQRRHALAQQEHVDCGPRGECLEDASGRPIDVHGATAKPHARARPDVTAQGFETVAEQLPVVCVDLREPTIAIARHLPLARREGFVDAEHHPVPVRDHRHARRHTTHQEMLERAGGVCHSAGETFTAPLPTMDDAHP
jgi:hypothetical protein